LATVTAVPDWVSVPFHSWVIASPEFGQVQVSCQPFTALAASSVIVTLAWNPPGQLPVCA
jgi:hypothetical protein